MLGCRYPSTGPGRMVSGELTRCGRLNRPCVPARCQVVCRPVQRTTSVPSPSPAAGHRVFILVAVRIPLGDAALFSQQSARSYPVPARFDRRRFASPCRVRLEFDSDAKRLAVANVGSTPLSPGRPLRIHPSAFGICAAFNTVAALVSCRSCRGPIPNGLRERASTTAHDKLEWHSGTRPESCDTRAGSVSRRCPAAFAQNRRVSQVDVVPSTTVVAVALAGCAAHREKRSDRSERTAPHDPPPAPPPVDPPSARRRPSGPPHPTLRILRLHLRSGGCRSPTRPL